jgi:PAS domain-containing protein
MVANNFYRPLPNRTGLWATVCLPLLAGVGLLLVDVYLIPGAFAFPLLLLMLLIYLSLHLPPQIVLMWALIYAGVIYLLTVSNVTNAVTSPAFRPYLRTAIFLTGSTGAVLLAAFRQRLQAGHEALFHIISALPLAVIVSDIAGNILLLNEQAREVLKNHVPPAAQLSYFTLFLSPDDHSRTVARYISYFDPANVGTVSTLLRTRSEPPLSLHASITAVLVDGDRYAITMVERIEHVAEDILPIVR